MNNYNYLTSFTPTEIILKGEKKYIVKGYVSTIDEDLSNETLSEDAQKDILNQIKERQITFDADHEIYYDNGQSVNKPLSKIPYAKVIDAELDLNNKYGKKGVYVTVEMNQAHPNFKNIWDSVKNGFLHSFSVAFYPVEAISKKENGIWKSIVNKLNLINITFTGNPMNPQAQFTPVMKSVINDIYQNSFGEVKKEELKMSEQETNANSQANLKSEEMSEEEKKKKQAEEDAKKEKESKEQENKEKEIEKKSLKMIDDMKTELKTAFVSEIQLAIKKSQDDLQTQIKALTDKIDKIEATPVIKAIKQDMSKVYAKEEELSLKNTGLLQFIK